MLSVGKALVLAGTAVVPWLPVLALLIVPLFMLRKRWRPASVALAEPAPK